jgi:hypothetical protein
VPTVFRRIMRDRGIDKPIWIDESNVLTKNDVRVGSGEGPFRASLDEQASYVIQAMALARAAGVQRYSIYKLQDEFPENGDEYWGLTRNDGTLRPSYVAYQVAVKYLQGAHSAVYSWNGSQVPPSEAEISALLASNTNRVQWPWPSAANAVVLERGSERITVVWNASPEPIQIAIAARTGSAQLVDRSGQVTPIVPSNGQYSLRLEQSRNNSDPRDTSLYLVGGSPMILVETLAPLTPTVAPLTSGSPATP